MTYDRDLPSPGDHKAMSMSEAFWHTPLRQDRFFRKVDEFNLPWLPDGIATRDFSHPVRTDMARDLMELYPKPSGEP